MQERRLLYYAFRAMAWLLFAYLFACPEELPQLMAMCTEH